MLKELSHSDMKIFVIWEPMLVSDVSAPSNSALARIPDARVAQFWDNSHVVAQNLAPELKSEALHVAGKESLVKGATAWDCVLVLNRGERWTEAPPHVAFAGAPVVNVVSELRQALQSGGSAAAAR